MLRNPVPLRDPKSTRPVKPAAASPIFTVPPVTAVSVPLVVAVLSSSDEVPLAVITALQDGGARIQAYDPEGLPHARKLLENVIYADSAYGCLKDADAMVIVTEWDEFRALDLARAKSVMKAPVLVDLRNIYRPEAVQKLGFTYESVGRRSRAT